MADIKQVQVGSTTYDIKDIKANIAYGTCSTAAGTAAKVISVSNNASWTLTAGSMVTVLFSATNTAQNPTFNVNGTGAKNVYYTSSQITTSNLSYAGYESRPMTYMYDGTQYRFIGWGVDSNSDTKVQQNAAITTAGEYPVILAYSTSTSKVTNAVNKTSTLKYNPNTQILTAPTFNGNLTGNADTATSATNDINNNPIVSTYETKEDASAKLAEAKEYADSIKNDMSTVPIAKGGTGATTADAARTNLGAAPAYQYSSTDLTAGTSALTTGTLYFVYE